MLNRPDLVPKVVEAIVICVIFK